MKTMSNSKTFSLTLLATMILGGCATTGLTNESNSALAKASLSTTLDAIKSEIDDYTIAQHHFVDGEVIPRFTAACNSSTPFFFLISGVDVNMGVLSTTSSGFGAGTVLVTPPGFTLGADTSSSSSHLQDLKMSYQVDKGYFKALKAEYIDNWDEFIDREKGVLESNENRLFRHMLNVTKGVAETNDLAPCLTLKPSPQFTFNFETIEKQGGSVGISLIVLNIGGSREASKKDYNTITFTLQPVNSDGKPIEVETFR